MSTTTKPELVAVKADVVEVKKHDLEARVADRRRELIEELIEFKKRSGLSAVEAGDAIKRRLSELDHLVKQSIVDGWQNISEAARARLESWIDR